MMIGPPSFEIRSLTEDQAGGILEVYRQCEDFLALGPEPAASMTMVLKDLQASRREGGLFCGIFATGGRMIGVVDVVPSGFEGDPRAAFFSLLMIAASFRRQGIGTAVVQRVENEIWKDAEVTSILTAVQANNPQALRFWQDHGYRFISGPELQPDQTTTVRLRKDCQSPTALSIDRQFS